MTMKYSSTHSTSWRSTATTYVACLPLSMRKTNLVRLLARRPDGFFVTEFEHGDVGPDLRVACRMGLEGLVSKRRDRPYEAGRSKHWIKLKNRTHPAMER
jgi:bifunctional non-homologous end joining protein LigD